MDGNVFTSNLTYYESNATTVGFVDLLEPIADLFYVKSLAKSVPRCTVAEAKIPNICQPFFDDYVGEDPDDDLFSPPIVNGGGSSGGTAARKPSWVTAILLVGAWSLIHLFLASNQK